MSRLPSIWHSIKRTSRRPRRKGICDYRASLFYYRSSSPVVTLLLHPEGARQTYHSGLHDPGLFHLRPSGEEGALAANPRLPGLWVCRAERSECCTKYPETSLCNIIPGYLRSRRRSSRALKPLCELDCYSSVTPGRLSN